MAPIYPAYAWTTLATIPQATAMENDAT
uniref:Uncharacterized protein n=1 Tax=Arundo donax TaxID=35708 RepID=A0A0A8YCU2_ARUDO